MKKTLLGIACFLALPSSICHAEDANGWPTFDLNKDSALTLTEFGNYQSNIYVELDTNLDLSLIHISEPTRPY